MNHASNSEPPVGIEPTTAPHDPAPRVAPPSVDRDSASRIFAEPAPNRIHREAATDNQTTTAAVLVTRALANRFRVRSAAERALLARDAAELVAGTLDRIAYANALCRYEDGARMEFTYFIRMDAPVADPPIKIGTTRDLAGRMETLRCGSPYPLTLLATVPGALLPEPVVHAAFRAGRTLGEWFRPTDRLLDVIASLNDNQTTTEPSSRPAPVEDAPCHAA